MRIITYFKCPYCGKVATKEIDTEEMKYKTIEHCTGCDLDYVSYKSAVVAIDAQPIDGPSQRDWKYNQERVK